MVEKKNKTEKHAVSTGCACCDSSCNIEKNSYQTTLIRLSIAMGLFLIGLVGSFSFPIELLLFLASYFVAGGDVLLRAIRNIVKGKVFDENFLMALATVGAFAIGEFPEGVAVMVFYQVGELFQEIAVNRSKKSIRALLDIRPDAANLKMGDAIMRVKPEDVGIGDLIIVKPGEKIPLDGRVTEGSAMLDTSAITGESILRVVEAGDEVLSGFINQNGLLTLTVTKVYGESTVAKILNLVENATNKKAPTENFITKFAKVYTPVVVVIALILALVPPIVIADARFSDWVYRALVFLVVSCPCALVISIPLGFFGGIGAASKSGILIKGGHYLEALNNVDTVVFDKTGTLTKGVFAVSSVHVADSQAISEQMLLEYAAYAESYSNHPIAKSILKAYGRDVDQHRITAYEERSGQGISITIDQIKILVGNHRLLQTEGIFYDKIVMTATALHVAIQGVYAGTIEIEDQIKEDAKEAVAALRELGIKKQVMLTGDHATIANRIGAILKLDQVFSELLPHQKVEKLEALAKEKAHGKKLIFVGDGINDAPVLAQADIGIAMGGLGSDAAIEAADVVLMTDEPSKLVEAIRIAKRTRQIVWQNILFAMGVKGIVLLLGAGGIASMWEAVFADVGVAVLAILNAMRLIRKKS